MDTSHIPRVFWYAVSVSLLIATTGLVYVAFRSTTVSIEIADAKIDLTRAASKLEEKVEQVAAANEELKEDAQVVQAAVKTAKSNDATLEDMRNKILKIEEADLATSEIPKEDEIKKIEQLANSVKQVIQE